LPVTAANSVDGGLLVGAGIYKRFGALTVLDGVNFTLAPKEATLVKKYSTAETCGGISTVSQKSWRRPQ